MAAPAAKAGTVERTTPSRLIDLITLVDNVDLDFESNHDPYYRFFLSPDPRPHGYIHPKTIALLPWPPSFVINHDRHTVTLAPPPEGTSLSAHANPELQAAVDAALSCGSAFSAVNGHHSEPFRVLGAREFVQIERFTAPLFGIATRGAHLTGYTRSLEDGQLKVWVARRSRSLFTYPGMLDSTVAGGVKADNSPLECILAESFEEASLSAALVSSRVRPVGVITLANRNVRTELFHGEVLYVYDLELAPDVVPQPSDGEVEEFVLMGCDEVRQRMLAGEFKPNVCAVMIDFLIRHGEITPEGEGEGAYVELCSRLRRKLPMPTQSDQ